MIGYASKKFMGGVIASYAWEFPIRITIAPVIPIPWGKM
jgi:hypothetical protein